MGESVSQSFLPKSATSERVSTTVLFLNSSSSYFLDGVVSDFSWVRVSLDDFSRNGATVALIPDNLLDLLTGATAVFFEGPVLVLVLTAFLTPSSLFSLLMLKDTSDSFLIVVSLGSTSTLLI